MYILLNMQKKIEISMRDIPLVTTYKIPIESVIKVQVDMHESELHLSQNMEWICLFIFCAYYNTYKSFESTNDLILPHINPNKGLNNKIIVYSQNHQPVILEKKNLC